MPNKTYVLDTSALLSNGKRALFAFGDNEVVIPLVVIKELESKRNDSMLGFVARSVLRTLEDLRNGEKGDFRKGIKINDNGRLIIEINNVNVDTLPLALRDGSHDIRILTVANNIKNKGEKDVTLISNDLPMRLLAEASLGLNAEPFRVDGIDQGEYTGVFHIDVEHEILQMLYDEKSISVFSVDLPSHIGHNAGLVIHSGNLSALAIKRGDNIELRPERRHQDVFGVKGKNSEQKLALEHLIDQNIEVVSLGGKAGTGKSLIALAAGLLQVEENKYSKVMVFRPLEAVGKQELGFLPGDLDQKMEQWGAAVYDALEAVATRDAIDHFTQRGQLEVLPITFVRGRTFHNSFVIIDEAQNLETATLLTILSRLGEGSKAVFSWDASQRDNLHIGQLDGIVPIVDYLKKEEIFTHTTLRKTERSRVADLATRILDDLHF